MWELRLDTCRTGAEADKMRFKWTQAFVDALRLVSAPGNMACGSCKQSSAVK